MTFQKTAIEVVRDSIRSAICIDDKYASAYSEDKKLNHTEPKKLYESFRKEGKCDLDIYQFKNLEESWDPKYMLANKDLMILDWELDELSEPKYKDTLLILNDVIESNQIPFVVIYTDTADLSVVSKNLISTFFSLNQTFDRVDIIEKINKCLKPICDLIDGEEVEIEAFLDKHQNQQLLLNYIQDYSKREIIKELIIDEIRSVIPIKAQIKSNGICNKIYNEVKSLFSDQTDFMLNLAFLGLVKNETKRNYTINRIESDSILYKINSTSVLVYRKEKREGGIKADELFKHFSGAVVSNPHNYLTLLSLELKDQLREEFSKIGTKFSSINERAFFFHMDNYNSNTFQDPKFNKSNIFDIVVKSWVQDLNYNKLTRESKVLNLVDEGYKKVITDEKLLELDNSLINDVVKYSAYLTTHNSLNKDRKLQFGDVFRLNKKEYFLCITPHCDCAETSKINNNFYFIKGCTVGSELAIKEAETGFHSFFNIEGEPGCVKWNCKPFTGYIKTNIISDINFNYTDERIDLTYITSLKENFAQRLSNEAFGYGYRVGIDLPKLKSK
jgi:hypothetical protein